MPNKKIVGLDISDYSIEAVEIEREGADEKIIAYNRSILEPGIVQRGIIKDKKKLAAQVLQTLATAKPAPIDADQIVFGLPESRIFLHFFSLDRKEGGDISQKVKKEAVNIIPIPEEEMVLAFKEIKTEANNPDFKNIIIAATSQQILADWEKFFKSIKLSLVFFDIECLASFRGLYDELPEQPICLVDLGAETISFSIFSQDGLEYNYQMQYGGKYLSAKLASGLRLDLSQAEIVKKETTLTASEKNIGAKEIIGTVFTHVSEEIRRNIDYFLEKHPEISSINKIILIGGSSQFKGLPEFFIEKGLKGTIVYKNSDLKYQDLGIEYLEAVGLCRRYFNGYWQNDLFFATNSNNLFKDLSFFYQITQSSIYKKIKKIPKKIIYSMFAAIFLLMTIFFILSENEMTGTNPSVKINIPEIKTETNKPDIPSAKEAINVKVIKKVKIKDIGANLNVRQGSDKTSAIVAQVKSGTVYAILEEKSGWFKIEYEKSKFGWVVSEYVEVLNGK